MAKVRAWMDRVGEGAEARGGAGRAPLLDIDAEELGSTGARSM